MFNLQSIGCAVSLGIFALGCSASLGRQASEVGLSRASCEGGRAEGDAELATFQGCQRIRGDLKVRGVTSLAALAALETVDGALEVSSTELRSLDGLEQLRAARQLRIEHNPSLGNASALGSLRSAEDVAYVGNPELDFPPALRLTELHSLSIERSGFLTLSGLEQLRRVDSLRVVGNRRLVSLAALAHVERVDHLVIERNRLICGALGILDHLARAPWISVIRHNPTLFAGDTAHLVPHAPLESARVSLRAGESS